MRLLLSLVAAGAVVGTAGVAMAQPAGGAPAPTAQALHERGRDRAKAWRQSGDQLALQEATQLFKDALALGDDPLIECDLGLALHYLGEEARAHARLTRCMPRLAAVSPGKVAGYRGVEDEVAAAVAKDHVAVDVATSPPGAVVSISSFPADETVLAPTLIWLRPGTYTLTAHVDGHVDISTTIELTEADVAARARKTWRGKLEKEPGELAPIRRDPEVPPVRVEASPPARSKTPAYLTLAAGGALLVGAGVVHYLAYDKRAHLKTLRGAAYEAYLPTYEKYQRATIGLYAAGAIATGVGTWLYLRARTPAPIAVSPTPEGDGAMVWVYSSDL